jgi:hypothetical protein
MLPYASGVETPRASLVAALVGALVYAASLGGDFVLDDHTAVEASQCVTAGLDLSAVFSRNFWCQAPGAETIDSWRPIPVLAWWAAWQVGGGDPWPFHLLNVALHSIVCALVVRLGRTWLPVGDDATDPGLWAGLAFAALPIHAEAVASIVGAAELWAAGLGVAAVWFASRANIEPARRVRWWSAAVVALAGALLSKESSVIYPVVVAMLVWSSRHERRAKLACTAVLAAVVLTYLLVRAEVLGSWFGTHVTATVNPLVSESVWIRLAMAPALLGRYLIRSGVGYPMSADYSVEQIPVDPVDAYGLVGVVAVGGALWGLRRWRSHPSAVYITLWFLVAAALAVNVVAPLPAMFAERLFYGPSVPLCLMAGVGLAHVVSERERRGVVLAGAVVAAWSFAAAVHAWRWTTEDRITEVTAEHSSHSARAHIWRARVLGRQGDFEGMREHAKAATEILPTWANATALLAVSMDATGEPERALDLFRRAADMDPADAEVADLFIQFLLRYGHTELARRVYARHAHANGGTAAPSVTRP